MSNNVIKEKAMSIQFIHDKQGNTTGVYISIEEWQTLKTKYSDLQKEEAESLNSISNWQKDLIDIRLSDYYNNPTEVSSFDQTLDQIEKMI